MILGAGDIAEIQKYAPLRPGPVVIVGFCEVPAWDSSLAVVVADALAAR